MFVAEGSKKDADNYWNSYSPLLLFDSKVPYMCIMLLLLLLSIVSLILVVNNILQLLVGCRSLPSYIELGDSSLSSLGVVGALLQATIIVYLMLASVVGFYSIPVLNRLRPSPNQTPMAKIIANCAVLLILSSALPVLARTLGITNFNLLGDYGRMNWLSNFHLVCWYNIAFIVSTLICLVGRFDGAVRHHFLS